MDRASAPLLVSCACSYTSSAQRADTLLRSKCFHRRYFGARALIYKSFVLALVVVRHHMSPNCTSWPLGVRIEDAAAADQGSMSQTHGNDLTSTPMPTDSLNTQKLTWPRLSQDA